MIKRYNSAIKNRLIILFFILFTGHAGAQTLSFEYADTFPELDGVIDTLWEDYKYNDINKVNSGTVDSDADLSGRFKAFWNDSDIYFLLVVKDDVFHSDNESWVWNDDSFELYFDADNMKYSTYDANDFQFQFRYNDNTPHESKHNKTEGVIIGQSQLNDTLIYEVRIPLATLGLSGPLNDQLMGFDIHLNDDDDTGAREAKKAWYTEFDLSSKNPAYFGIVKFDGYPENSKTQKPDFSHERGFYNSAFNLSVSSVPGSKIVYTLDGSDPKFSDTREEAASPATISIDPNSSTNRGGKTPGVIVRAVAKSPDNSYSKIITHTYLFTQAIINQSNPGGIWNDPYRNSSWPGYDKPQSIDYDMDRDITQNSNYKDLMDDALLAIPSYSIVTNYLDMFDAESGIFMNALEYGWERPVSLEMINPGNHTGFQVDAGIRIRGRYSRLSRNPKHSFRIMFRDEYGESTFKYPVFKDDGTDEFKRLDFRTAQNSSWNASSNEEETVTFIKEIFSRDTQRKMGMYNTRSEYCHLYLNGMYWGLFQIQERADDNFAETYLGGDKDDYDIIKPDKDVKNPENDLIIAAPSGSLDPAHLLWDKTLAGFTNNAEYFDVQGMDEDGKRNYSKDRLLDIENFIDYLLIAFYMGSEDGPIVTWTALWGEFVRPNNFIGIYNRKSPDGFKWIVHDFEKSMYDENDSWPLIEDDSWFSDNFNDFNPVKIHRELLKNEEYVQKMADRIHKYFGAGGVFSADSVKARLNKRRSQIELPVIAESARWGDWNSWRPLQTQDHWKNNVNWLINTYASKRTSIVLNQFKSLGIINDVKPPVVSKNGNQIQEEKSVFVLGDKIQINDVNTAKGEIYYTLDGSDPRSIGGIVSAHAMHLQEGTEISVSTTNILKTRIQKGDEWSALEEVLLISDESLENLKFTELHYHPEDNELTDGDHFEFIELKNTGTEVINLTGVEFIKGIQFKFGSALLQPGDFVVLGSDRNSFVEHYGFEPDGQYDGRLRNSGEEIVVSNAAGTDHLSLVFNDKEPWLLAPDGLGNSLVSKEINPDGNPNQSHYWRASTYVGGSPNADDPEPGITPVVINEVLAHTAYPLVDMIELYNPTDSDAHIGNWYLTDNKDMPTKWEIPANTTISPKGYITFNNCHFVDQLPQYAENEFGSSFAISSHGEELFLFSSNASGDLSGYVDGVEFGESEFGISFGRYTNSQHDVFFVAQKEVTEGKDNSLPMVGPVVISEIMYDPPEDGFEYLQLKNISTNKIQLFAVDNPLNTWKINGIDFDFPTNITLDSGDSLYIIEGMIDAEVFRKHYDIEKTSQVFNMKGTLDDTGETLSLLQPTPEYLEKSATTHGYFVREKVQLDNKDPWYAEANGTGQSLARAGRDLFANDPENWDARDVKTTVGINEIKQNAFKLRIYPNPTNGKLSLDGLSSDMASITVLSLDGKLRLTFERNRDMNAIDISELTPGLYLVRIKDKLGVNSVVVSKW